MSAQTYFFFTGGVAALASALLIHSQLRNRQLRSLQKKMAQENTARIAALENANATKDRFLTTLSHEIRNPLNGISGLAESLEVPALDQKNRLKLDLLRQCTVHLSSLLDDVLDFSRVQPDAFKVNPRAFDVHELMNSVAVIASADSGKYGLPVQIAISPETPRYVVGDPLRIRQILLNYVYNALKYSVRGKINVTAWQNRILNDSAEIFFAVSDEGPGISPQDQTRLFVPLEFMAETTAVLQAPRKALGLSICKTLAEKLNGTVWVESEPGKGSVFYFKATFPIAQATNVSGIKSIRTPNGYKTALVIDDEEYNRVALTGLLETLGLQIFAAAHDRQAFELSAQHDFDLIFVDYSIPGLNGAAIAQEIRRQPGPSQQAAIFATTAFNTPEIRSTCLAAGMDAFLTKPITLEQLRLALGAIAIKDEPARQTRPATTAPLANLRLLAKKKGLSFEEEVKLYLAEFKTEFDQLEIALRKEDSGRAAYYAHLLYGRCSFISERSLETKLRKVEFAAATGRWDEAHAAIPGVKTELAQLQIRLGSNDPTARPE